MLRRSFVALCCSTLLFAGCNTPTADPVTVRLDVPDEGIATPIEQKVPLGAEVTLVVTTAKDDGIHVHGYEYEFNTTAGEPHELVFTANMAGAYEVESHSANQVYMKLIVQ